MKLLHLSVVTQVVNEKGEELLEKASSKKPKEVGGLNREWFEEQGLKPPKEFEDDEIERDEDGAVILDEDVHLNYESTQATLPLKNIDSWVESSEIGTIVYMKSGVFYNVYETVDEIDDYVNFLNLGKLESVWIDIKIFFRRIKYKMKKYNYVAPKTN